jgi:hypothetical protein
MRVTIEIEEAFRPREIKSFLDRFKPALTDEKWWVVKTTIVLSEEERAILSQRNLWKVILFKRETHDYADIPFVSYSIQDVLSRQPFPQVFDTPVDAKNFQHRLETEILPLLKSFIQSSAEVSSSKTFEL